MLFFECELWAFLEWPQNILKLILLLSIAFAMLREKCAVVRCMFENVLSKRRIKMVAKAKPRGGLKLVQFASLFLLQLQLLVLVLQFRLLQFRNPSLSIFQIFLNG